MHAAAADHQPKMVRALARLDHIESLVPHCSSVSSSSKHGLNFLNAGGDSMPEEQMVRLIAPPGTDEANYGTTRYKVHDDGTITVPAEVAKDLVHGAGFFLAPVQPVTVQPAQPVPDEDAVAAAFGDSEV
jgi:hypothetical protein